VTRLAIALVLGATALAAAAPGQSFRKNQPARVTVEARAASAITKAAQTVDLMLTATPLPGIHVYAPGNPNYIAVTVTMLPVTGLSMGAAVFPAGEDYFFAPLKEAVKVYTKPFVVRLPVKIETTFTRGRGPEAGATVTVKGAVDYQACDDKVCFPPQSQAFAVDVPVKLARR
jgi:DsbC/DsbD-like thiol-disulfide interchange protein